MTTNETPAGRLASLVVDRLIKEGLLRPEKRDQLIAKISMAEMTEGDWDLEIDLSSGKEVGK